MTTFLSILAALLVLSVFVVVHELGHFLAGRWLGFTVLEFAVGMGPAIVKKEKNGILYSLRAFPIGGMCRFMARMKLQKIAVRSHRIRYGSALS